MEKLPVQAQMLLDDFYAVNAFSQSTRLNYYKALLSYCRATGADGLGDLCNQNLAKWYSTLTREGYAPGSIFLYGNKLRSLYVHFLRQQGLRKGEAGLRASELFDAIPLGALRRAAAKANQLRDKLVSPQEFQALLNASDHPRVRAYLAMLYESACRPDELLRLRLRDIEWRDRYIQIRVCGKTGERTIPLVRSIPYLRAWLTVHPDRANPDAPLFLRQYRGRLSVVTVAGFQETFKYLRQKAGFKRHVNLYQLRHTRLTELAAKGLGEFHLKKVAGWTLNSDMAATYIHLSGEDCLASLLKLEGISTDNQPQAIESPIRLRQCPRCGSANEADAPICNHCNLILDDKAVHARIRLETETDGFMDVLINHPKVRSAIRQVLEELKANGKLPLQIEGVET
jgi:integrase